MANKDKYTIIIEAQETASDKITRLTKKFEALGGDAALKAAKDIRKLELAIKKVSPPTKKATGIFSKFTLGIAKGNIIANAATKALKLLSSGVKEVGKAVLVAARVKVLNTTLTQMGKNSGIAAHQVQRVKNQIVALGITERNAIGVQQRFIQSELEIADAVKVARLAQDAAVIAGLNSSDAALQITDAINKQRPILLRQFGIMTNLKQLYQETAEKLGKTSDELTKSERKNALLNDVLRQGKLLSGNYVAAMRDVGKQMTSLPRWFENAQVAVGEKFAGALKVAVFGARDLLIGIEKLFISTAKGTAKVAASKKAFEDQAKTQMELVGIYETLSKKANLSNKEHDELSKTIDSLSIMFPGAIDKWNEYGEAIGLSTGEIKRQIEAKRSLFRLQEGEQISDLVEEYTEYQEKIAASEKAIAKLQGQQLKSSHDKLITDVHDQTKSQEQLNAEIAEQRELQAGLQKKVNDYIVSLDQAVDATDEAAVKNLGLTKSLVEALFAYQNVTGAIDKKTQKQKEEEEQLKKLAALTEFLTNLENKRAAVISKGAAAAAATAADMAVRRANLLQEGLEKEFAIIEAEEARERTRNEADFNNKKISLEDWLDLNEILHLESEQRKAEVAAEFADMAQDDLEERIANAEAAWENSFQGTAVSVGIQNISSQLQFATQRMFKMNTVVGQLGNALVSAFISKGAKALTDYITKISATLPLIAAETAATRVLTQAYINLAAAKAAASVGATTGPSIAAATAVKTQLTGLLQVFDDPVNDANLIKENRRIARFIIEGQQKGVQDAANTFGRKGQDVGQSLSVGDIIIQGDADASTVELLEEWKEDFINDMRDGFVPVNTTERLSRR